MSDAESFGTGSQWGGTAPPPEWQLPEPAPMGMGRPSPAPSAQAQSLARSPSPRQRGRSGLALAVSASVVAAVIGLGIGSRIHRPAPSPAPAAAASPIAPVTPVTPVSPSSPPSGSSNSADTSAIRAKVTPGIVDINTKLAYENAAGAGTGMILTSTGEILTNNHVIDGATSISVTVVATSRTYAATVVGTDPSDDVAVLQLQGASGLTPIPIGESSAVAVGDAVVALGNAGGVGGAPAAAVGTVTGINQTITASDQGGANAETLSGLIQINAAIQPGDSGGPLANSAGQVIGMDTAASGGGGGGRLQAATTVGFAIPIAHALDIARQIETGPTSASIHIGLPGFLGVAVSSNVSATAGAPVTGVQPGSPAASAGLVAGDTITSLNGQPVTTPDALSTLTRSHRPGEKVAIGWVDQAGARHRATVTLASGPAD